MSMVSARRRSIFPTLLAHAFLIVVAVVFLFPLYWLITSAFKSSDGLWALPPILLPTTGFNQVWQVIANNHLLRLFLHSVIASLASTAVVMVLASLLVYGLTRHDWPSRKGIASFIISLKIMPPITVIIPLYLLFSFLHLYDTMLGLTLVYVLFNLPLAIWLLIGFFNQIPRELDEAAWVEGANSLQTLWHIVLPLSRSSLIGVAAVSTMFAWNDYIFAVSLTSNHAVTLTVGAAGFLGDYIYQWSSFYTAGAMEIVPMLLIAIILQRYLLHGLSFGTING